jgi:hypothetical protein
MSTTAANRRAQACSSRSTGRYLAAVAIVVAAGLFALTAPLALAVTQSWYPSTTLLPPAPTTLSSSQLMQYGGEAFAPGLIPPPFTFPPAAGDYCNHWFLYTPNVPLQTDLSPLTGAQSATPYSQYQLTDPFRASGDPNPASACQLHGSQWGQWLNTDDTDTVNGQTVYPTSGWPNNQNYNCENHLCGMAHSVSYGGGTVSPWDPAYSQSTGLHLTGTTTVQKWLVANPNSAAWGYLCVDLEDLSYPQTLEVCLVAWTTSSSPALDRLHGIGIVHCGYPGVTEFDTPVVANTSDPYITVNPGSGYTLANQQTGTTTLNVSITPANMQAIVNQVDKVYNCQPSFSSTIWNYRLLGMSHGLEADGLGSVSGGSTYLGGNASALTAQTSYQPGVAVWSKPSQGAWYNGSLDSGVPGSGQPMVSQANPSPLLSASSGEQWVYYVGPASTGGDEIWAYYYAPGYGWYNGPLASTSQNYVAPLAGTPTVLRNPSSTQQWVYYAATGGAMGYWYWDNTQQQWYPGYLGPTNHPVATGGSPTAVTDGTSQWIYYTGSDGQMYTWSYSGGWTNAALATGQAAAAGKPAVVISTAAPAHERWVYYVGTNGYLYVEYYNSLSGGWTDYSLGQLGPSQANEPVMSGTSAAAIRDSSTGDQWIYYVGADGQVWAWAWAPSSGWWNGRLGNGVAAVSPATSPTAVRESSGGQHVYYVGSDGRLYSWDLNPSTGQWSNSQLSGGGVHVADGVSPAVLEDANNDQWVYY